MTKLPLYYIYGDDTEVIEKKWLPDLDKKYPGAAFLRYDASIDEMFPAKLATELLTNDLFSKGRVIVIRNADQKAEPMEALLSTLLSEGVKDNSALVLLAKGLNKTTRLGKLVKDNCIVHAFEVPELKPFDLLDALNTKSSSRALQQASKLFAADYPPLALYSLLCGHLFLMKKVKDRQNLDIEDIARELKEHVFRIKKIAVANRYWTTGDIQSALKKLSLLGDLLRTWQYDGRMLIEMTLISITI